MIWPWVKRQRHSNWGAEGHSFLGSDLQGCHRLPLGWLGISFLYCTFIYRSVVFLIGENALISLCFYLFMGTVQSGRGRVQTHSAPSVYLSMQLGRQSQKTKASSSCQPRGMGLRTEITLSFKKVNFLHTHGLRLYTWQNYYTMISSVMAAC